MNKVLLVIPAYNAENHIVRCISSINKSIAATGYNDFKTDIVVVDDCSSDATIQKLNEIGFGNIITGSGDLWWSGSVNKGVEVACSKNYDYILLFNADNYVPENYFAILYDCLKKKPGCIIGSTVYTENEDAFFLGCQINTFGQFEYTTELKHVFTKNDIFGGMGVAIPVNIVRRIGRFDEKKLPLYFGDTDFWVRCKKNHFSAVMCKNLKVWVDAKNTGAKTKGNKIIFFLKNLTNRKFHANVVSVSNFYRNNFALIGLPVFIFLFYFNYLLSNSRKGV